MNISKRYHKTTSLLILALLLASISYFTQNTHHLLEDFSCRIKVFLSALYRNDEVQDTDIAPKKTFTIFPLHWDMGQDHEGQPGNDVLIEIG